MPTPQERLAAFEAEHLGEDAPRHNGTVERGHGSRYQKLKPELKHQHAALERLVEASKEHAEAERALATAAEKLAEAERRAPRPAWQKPTIARRGAH